LDEAERALQALDVRHAPAPLRAEIYLAWVELHVRTPNARAARAALDRAARAARSARIRAISQEVRTARALLEAPAARLIRAGTERLLGLSQVESLLRTPRGLLIDARESSIAVGQTRISLHRRPVLFGLVRVLAEAWPSEVTRSELLARVFAVTRANDSHRARLRVELARLRRLLQPLATIAATRVGFRLEPSASPEANAEVRVLLPISEGEHSQVLTLLADGEAWSSSALALALGVNQRTIQRSLLALEAEGRTRATGRARAKRWLLAPPNEFATPLLLPGPLRLA
jgi:hypothetical protein